MSGPIGTDVSGDTPAVPNASYQSGSVTLSTTATLIAVVPEGYTGALLVTASASGVFVGGPGVTTGTGYALPTTPVQIPGGKGNARALYGVATSGTPTVSYLLAAD